MYVVFVYLFIVTLLQTTIIVHLLLPLLCYILFSLVYHIRYILHNFLALYKIQIYNYNKTCLKRPLKNKTINCFSRPIITQCRSKVLQNAPRGAFYNTFDLH